MNTLRVTIQAAISDPDLHWHFWIDSGAGVWRAGLYRAWVNGLGHDAEAGPTDFQDLASIIHAAHIPRAVRHQLADLLRHAGLSQERARTL